MNTPGCRAVARRPAAFGARLAAACACVVLLAAGCGKKGPPLPPLPNFPVAPADVSVTRRGDEVTIRFKVPGANASGISPANIERVDVYAWTGEPMAPAEAFKHAAVVASVPVRRPPPPPEPAEEGEPPPPPPPPPMGPGLDQGAAGELTEVLGPEAFEPIRIEKEDETEDREPEPAVPKLAPPDLGPPLPPPLTRHYVVVGVTRGGRRGAPAAAQAVPLWPAPPPPPSLAATVREGAVDLSWAAPEGLRAPVQPRALPPPPPAPASPAGRPGARPAPGAGTPGLAQTPSSPGASPPAAGVPVSSGGTAQAAPAATQPAQTAATAAQTATPPQAPSTPSRTGGMAATPGQAPLPAGAAQAATPGAEAAEASLLRGRLLIPWPASTSGYKVYEVPPPGKAPAVEPGAAPPLPTALTPAPIVVTSFTDPRLELGVERCYTVRSVATVGALSVESAPAEPVCVKPSDVFPPAAPASLAAVASEGAISLIWDGNREPDLAGYLVFRGVAPGEKLEAITPKPIRETTYRDTAVKPGERYVYVVVAVDTAQPPNVSPQSNRVEEVAR